MQKKLNTKRLIAVFSFIIAIAGIINDGFFSTMNRNVLVYKDILNPFELDWIFSGHSLRYNGYNFVNAFFYFLLLIGAILYVASGRKESRLIRFVSSITLLSNILILADFFLELAVVPPGTFVLWLKSSPWSLLSYVITLFWIFISYRLLSYFNKTHRLQTETYEQEGKLQVYFVKASNFQRFLHPVIDTIVTICLFSISLQIAGYNDMDSLSRYMLQSPEGFMQRHIFLIIIILRIIYYLFYETILGATPAKFLTGTRVVDYDGSKPRFKNIFIRTVSRLVPFEAFSFFADDGWHDKWSETMVAKEEIKEETNI